MLFLFIYGIEKKIHRSLHLPFKPALSPPSHKGFRAKDVQLVYAASLSGYRLPADEFPADLHRKASRLSLVKWKPIYKYKGVIFFG